MGARSRREKLLGWISLSVLLIYPVGNLWLELAGITTGPRLNDFGAYYHVGHRLIHGYPIYDFSTDYAVLSSIPYAHMGYLYFPTISLIFVPFALLPFNISGLLWNVICLFVLWRSVIQLIRALDVPISRTQQGLGLWLLLGFAPTITWIKLGQISGLLAAGLCLCGSYVLREGHGDDSNPFAGAIAILFVALTKPFYAISATFVLFNRKRLLFTSAGALAIVTISVSFFGIPTHVDYIHVLAGGKGWQPGSTWNASSFRPLAMFGSFALLLKATITIIVLLITLGTRWQLRENNKSDAATRAELMLFTLGVACVPLVSPSSNVLALNALIPAFVIVIVTERRRVDGFVTIPLLSLLLVQAHPYTIEFIAKFGTQYIPDLAKLHPYLTWIQPGVWGLLLLVAFVTYRLIGDVSLLISLRSSRKSDVMTLDSD